MNSSGYGAIGELTFKVPSTFTGNTLQDLKFSISNYQVISKSGTFLTVNTVSDSVTVKKIPQGMIENKNTSSASIIPNPFNHITTAGIELKESSYVNIILTDILGKEIETLENKFLTAGNYTYKIELEKKGLYFLRSLINGIPSTTKLIQIQ